MSNNKTLYIIIIVLVLIIIGGIFFFSQKETPVPTSPTTENVVDSNLSEQPDRIKFSEYFTGISLDKLPAGAKFEPFKIVRTNIFSLGEQFCISMDMKKQIPANTLSSVVYDVNAKQDTQTKGGAFPQALGPGNSIGCENLSQPIGKYENKIYLNNVLVSVLPFEVK
ncbi:MAG: hypothetical protein NT161_02130 [Candidatus Nomurabacteria bacterium]|nr:hypothetical protein [Candidatus Nomurabacteria bacterium]